MGAAAKSVVEFALAIENVADIAGDVGGLQLIRGGLELGQIAGARALDKLLSDQRLELGADAINIFGIRRCQDRDHEAFLRGIGQNLMRLELAQGFPERGAADVEPAAKVFFDQPLARFEDAPLDRPPEGEIDLMPDRRRFRVDGDQIGAFQDFFHLIRPPLYDNHTILQ